VVNWVGTLQADMWRAHALKLLHVTLHGLCRSEYDVPLSSERDRADTSQSARTNITCSCDICLAICTQAFVTISDVARSVGVTVRASVCGLSGQTCVDKLIP
jgi:hypothetical protein